MNINKSNIDEVLFDYFEGNLSVQDKLQVEKFIAENPSFQKDFNAWESSFVQDEHLQFKNVDALLANEDNGKAPWFKWGLSSLILVLLSFLSYAVYNEFSGKKEKANNNDNTDKNNNGTSSSSSKGMLLKDNAPTVATIVKENKRENTSDKTITKTDKYNIAQTTSTHTKTSKTNTNSDIAFGTPKEKHTNINSSTASSDINTNISGAVVNNEQNQSQTKEITIDSKGWSVFNHSIVNAVAANISKKGGNEMNDKPGQIEIINLNDPFVLYGGVTPIQENPSFTGNADGIRIKSVSRWEWPELKEASFLTNAISIDAYSNRVKGGLGLVLSSDIMGTNKYNATAVSLVYSPKIKIKNISFEPSINAGLSYRNINWTHVGTGDFIDPRTGTLLASSAILPENISSSSFLIPNIGAGFLMNHKAFYAGFAADNIYSPSYKDDVFDQAVRIPLKITAQLGTDIRKNARSPWVYSPSINIRKQGLYTKVWMSNVVRYNKLLLGAHFSTADAMMFTAGYANTNFRITYNYSLSTVPFNAVSGSNSMIGSHQITMRYVIKKTKE